jgi:hypothetical protein
VKDDPDPPQWTDPDSQPPGKKEPNPIWEALHLFIDELQAWAGQTAHLARRVRQLLAMLIWRGALIVSASVGTYELVTGVSMRSLAVAHPLKVVLGVLLFTPFVHPTVRTLSRESRRYHKRTLRVADEAVHDYGAQISSEARSHKDLGRRLPTSIDLAALPGTRTILEKTVADLQHDGYSPCIILIRKRHSKVEVVLTVGEIELGLSEGTTWQKEVIAGDSIPYASIIGDLDLQHAQVHFLTGKREWDLVCVDGGALSGHAMLQIAQAVTRVLELARDIQQSGGISKTDPNERKHK